MKIIDARAGNYNAKVPKKKGGDERLRIGSNRTAGKHRAVVLVVTDSKSECKEHEEADD
jgi:hypothetical protein